MAGLETEEASPLWRAVEYLDGLNLELARLVGDIRRLSGKSTARQLAFANTDLLTVSASLKEALAGDAPYADVRDQVEVVRQQMIETVHVAGETAKDLPSAKRLVNLLQEQILNLIEELPDVPPPAASPPDHLSFSTLSTVVSAGPDVTTEVRQSDIRAFLVERGAVLVVDGDPVAARGWPELSVLVRRDSLLALLSLVRHRAEIQLVFDPRVGGREAITVADGVWVLLTSGNARHVDAVVSLISSRPASTPMLVVTDDEELAAAAIRMNRPVLSSSDLLLFLLNV